MRESFGAGTAAARGAHVSRWFVVALVLALGLVLGAGQGPVSAQAAPEDSDPGKSKSKSDGDGEILVKFKPGTSKGKKDETHSRKGGQVVEEIPAIGVQVVSVGGEADEDSADDDYKADKNVEYAEPNDFHRAIAYEDGGVDTRFGEQWQYNNTKQLGGTVYGADIDAIDAWNATNGGSSAVKIAILDTGIKKTHPDLEGKVDTGDEINFTTSSVADDNQGHGTHVAGSAAADTDNGVGVAGVGGNSRLVNVKVLDDSGSGAYSWITNGILWAAGCETYDSVAKRCTGGNGGTGTPRAKVINMSLGGTGSSLAQEDAVNKAWANGVVVVAAAGNSNSSGAHYPSDYEKVISVAATDQNDAKASYSNYGSKVDIAAPGSSILSTTRDGSYGLKSGTSMASPHVAGLAALVWSTTPDGTSAQVVRDRIESSATDRSVLSGTGPEWSQARINACKAVGGTTCDTKPDTFAPTVNSTKPIKGATGVTTRTTVTATFSEHVDPETITTGTFYLIKDGTATRISATVTYDPATQTATLKPSSRLERGKKYTATVDGVKDKALPTGNAIVPYSWSFIT